MNLKNYTLYISFSNFGNQDNIDLFLSNNLFNFCIDYQYEHISAISKLDYTEKILIRFNKGFIPDNRKGSYDISRDEKNLIINFKNLF
jgi:hypothetical protein